jgi:hypothetical protein
MGKAAIVGAVVVIVAVATIILIGWLRRQATKEKAADRGWALKGDLNKAQEREIIERLEQAAALLRDLATPPDSLALSATLLTPEDRGRVEKWLRDQNTTMKGISAR